MLHKRAAVRRLDTEVLHLDRTVSVCVELDLFGNILEGLNLAEQACETICRGPEVGHQHCGLVYEREALHDVCKVAADLANSTKVNLALKEHPCEQDHWQDITNGGVEELESFERHIPNNQHILPMQQLVEAVTNLALALVLTTVESDAFGIVADVHHGVPVVCLQLLNGVVELHETPREEKRDEGATCAVAQEDHRDLGHDGPDDDGAADECEHCSDNGEDESVEV
mmetsp:Transcript_78035/g.180963  ORF Transcript_78035/g.180963 Transcript_78035/m.180963 type:complete len:227 (+) Transcript_78035:681-1361(+)